MSEFVDAPVVATGATDISSLDELQTAHKKEMKALHDGYRHKIKQAKGKKGKKAKTEISALEGYLASDEFAMKSRHEEEIEALELALSGLTVKEKEKEKENEKEDGDKSESPPTAAADPCASAAAASNDDDNKTPALTTAEKKRLKAQRKREKKRQEEIEREKRIEEETANAGPGKREIELAQIRDNWLNSRGLDIVDVKADGNCLYRSIAGQIGEDYLRVRDIAASQMQRNPDDYSQFIDENFASYVEKVRSSDDWGGQIELRAIAEALQRPIEIYEASTAPLTMGEQFVDGEILRVAFHRHYYALGEHYNTVVKK